MKFLETKLFFFSIVLTIPIVLLYENYFSGKYFNQIILFSLPLLWPGLAHGSLDILIAKHKNVIKSKLGTIFFVVTYVSIPLIFFLMWINFPNFIFILFLFLSCLHFGISDCISKNKLIEVLVRGLIVISLPFKFHSEKSIEIFSFFLVNENFLSVISIYFDYIYILLILLILVWLVKNLNFFFKSNKSINLVIEISLLFFCFWFF